MWSGRLAIFGDAIAADPVLPDPLDLEPLLTPPGEGRPDRMGQPAQRFDHRLDGGVSFLRLSRLIESACLVPWRAAVCDFLPFGVAVVGVRENGSGIQQITQSPFAEAIIVACEQITAQLISGDLQY